jgi:Flotillin/Protein of unknown function (DUF1449)
MLMQYFMLFNPANLPYWILLGIGILLFLFVIASGGGSEDVDVDTDVDTDVDANADGEFSFGQVLGWAGIGKAPLILLLARDFSLWGLFGWILNVWLNSIINGIVGVFFASIVLFGSLIISLFTGGLIARPIGKIFVEFGEDATSDRNVVEIDAFRRRRQAEIAQQAAELEAEAIRTLADANRDKVLAEAEATLAKIAAENTISNANLTAKIITTIWPELSAKPPEILASLAPQPGVLGDTRIYSFPGANGSNGAQNFNKLLLSTSGLALINTLLEEGKLGSLIGQISQLARSNNPVITDTSNSGSLTTQPENAPS